jgi:hypothetical protein
MKLKQVVFVLVACGLLGLMFVASVPRAEAQSPICYYIGSATPAGWTVTINQGSVTGVGPGGGDEYTGQIGNIFGDTLNFVSVDVDFGGAVAPINQISQSWRINSAGAIGIGGRLFLYNGATLVQDINWASGVVSSGQLNVWVDQNNFPGNTNATRVTFILLTNTNGTALLRDLRVCSTSFTIPTATPTPTLTPTITPTSLPSLPTSGWAYPISTADQWEGSFILGDAVGDELKELDPVFEALLDSPAVLGFGKTRDTYVHAVYGGTVTEVVEFSPYCDPAREYTNIVQQWIGRSRSWCYQEWNPVVPTRGFRLNTDGAFRITVTLADTRRIRYVVANPRVETGDTVTTGCILGTLLPFSTDDLSVQNEQSAGWTFVQGSSAANVGFNLLPYLDTEPQDIVCAKTGVNSSCKLVANPTFSNRGSGWSIQPTTDGGQPDFTDGLGLRGSLSQVISLDSTKQYTITIKYRTLEQPAYAFNIRFGSGAAINVVPDDSPSQITKVIPAATYTPNSSEFGAELYSLIVSSTLSRATIAIDFICVSEANEPPPLPSACIFNDPDFETEIDSVWDTSGDWGEGYSVLTESESFNQSVKLNPASGGAQTYKLEVVAAINPNATTPFATTNIEWSWGSASGTLGPLTAKTFQTFTATFNVSAAATNTFLFDLATSSESVVFDRVCITTVDGTPPPGYEPLPPLKPACRTCIYLPSGDLATDMANLVRWLACFILQLWECQVKTILMGIWTTTLNILTFLGFLRLWFLISLQQIIGWWYGALLVGFQYLNGQFVNLGTTMRNALNGANISTVIIDDGSSFTDVLLEFIRGLRDLTSLPNNLIDAIESIFTGLFDFLSTAVAGLATVLSSLISLAQTVFQTIAFMIQSFIANVLGTLVSLIVGVVNGFNIGASNVIDADWIPDCNDPQSAMFTVCVALSLIENEINAGPAVLLIPLLIGVMSLSTILWAIERLSESVSGGDGDE